ncbi:MAG: hypothetical protein PUF48_06590 [Oscillospiraceae bacterium]|nr:hypothetical protein [Oscillospiraceae bacterium]
MHLDEDIKIAGDKPSYSVKLNKMKENMGETAPSNEAESAKKLGIKIAEKYITESQNFLEGDDGEYGYDAVLQRRLLLSFTATVGFERFCKNDTLAGIAQKSFIDRLRSESEEIYKTSSDMGAFSFYYLAFRRGGDIERRIGQTFAMLCSRDGDPIFQERGEALYCWFSAEIRKTVCEYRLDR